MIKANIHGATFVVRFCCATKVAPCILKHIDRTVASRTQQFKSRKITTTSNFMRLVLRKIKGCLRLHGPSMANSSSQVAASLRKKCLYCTLLHGWNTIPVPCSRGDKLEGWVDAYNPFTTISSPSALSHKTKTATIAPKASTTDLSSTLRNWVDSFPYEQRSYIASYMRTTRLHDFCHLSRDKSCVWKSSGNLQLLLRNKVAQQKLSRSRDLRNYKHTHTHKHTEFGY